MNMSIQAVGPMTIAGSVSTSSSMEKPRQGKNRVAVSSLMSYFYAQRLRNWNELHPYIARSSCGSLDS